jgi:hypothetical protein
MYDPINPYASPMTTEMNPVAVQWLGTPSASLTKVAKGLGLIYSGICLGLLSGIGGSILMHVVAAATRSIEAVGMIAILMGLGLICDPRRKRLEHSQGPKVQAIPAWSNAPG